MARPREISDQRLLAAIASAIGDRGPHKVTLADVATRAGVSTGILVQRFGSKRGMLLTFARSASPGPGIGRALTKQGDPADVLATALAGRSGGDMEIDQFVNHLAFLHLDLADPEFREALAAQEREIFDMMLAYLHAKVSDQVLVVENVADLAVQVMNIRHGVRIRWAIDQTVPLRDAMLASMRTLLLPYRHPEYSPER